MTTNERKNKMNSINIKSENFRQNLYDLINNSDLPASNIYFIITLLQKQIELNYYAILNSESPEEEITFQEEKEEEENK